MHDPDPTSRASNLRPTALASAIALVLALPLAFAAAGPPAPEEPAGATADSQHPPIPLGGPDAGAGAPGAEEGPGAAEAPAGPQAPAGAFCGPELTADAGVEAQTCVITEGRDTWGRVYYRNTTGRPLMGALSIMRPDGRTVEVSCEVTASDEPGLCETPREATVPDEDGRETYSAVAELAEEDGDRLLLRAGSSRADAGAADAGAPQAP